VASSFGEEGAISLYASGVVVSRTLRRTGGSEADRPNPLTIEVSGIDSEKRGLANRYVVLKEGED
jgi:hypothetical protein